MHFCRIPGGAGTSGELAAVPRPEVSRQGLELSNAEQKPSETSHSENAKDDQISQVFAQL